MYFCFSLNVSRNGTYLFRIYNLCLFRLYIIYADLLNSKQRLWFPITILILLVSFKQNNDKRNFFLFFFISILSSLKYKNTSDLSNGVRICTSSQFSPMSLWASVIIFKHWLLTWTILFIIFLNFSIRIWISFSFY